MRGISESISIRWYWIHTVVELLELNHDALNDIFKKEKNDDVIHFAGYKAVGKSVAKPLMYYYNNLNKTITLARLAEEYKIKHLSSQHQQLFMVIKNPLYMKH